MIVDKNRIFDGFDSMEGGVDAGRRPNVIGVNQVQSAENCIFRGGVPATRPGFRLLQPNFIYPLATASTFYNYNSDGDLVPPPTVIGVESNVAFFQDVFQDACYYSPKGGPECMVALIGGRLYRITPKDVTVDIEEIALDRRNHNDHPIAWMIQADKWLIAQDGESTPIIYDGIKARRAAEDEVPVGQQMAYGMGRIVVIKNGHEVWFGDLYGSHDGEPGDSVIKFTETTFLSEGTPASLPFELGRITGLGFPPQLDSSTGIGPLLIFTSRGVVSFDLSLQRDVWKTSAFQKLVLLTTGLRGWRSLISVNEDMWFRADDGARSFRQARSEATGWFHLPLSTNVRQWMDSDTPELLDYVNAIHFDNRLIFTCSPVWNHGRVFHNGLVVLDFDILSSFGSNSRPAWNGHWSKLRVTRLLTGIFNGRRRAFVFGLDSGGLNEVYELSENQRDDFDGPISSEMITRSFDFSRDQASNPFSEKELYSGDVWLNKVSDHKAYLDVQFRPDDYPEWNRWGERIPLDAIGEFQELNAAGEPTVREGFSPRATLFKPKEMADPTTKRNLRRGYEFQVKFNWTGYLAIQRFRIGCQQLIEKARA